MDQDINHLEKDQSPKGAEGLPQKVGELPPLVEERPPKEETPPPQVAESRGEKPLPISETSKPLYPKELSEKEKEQKVRALYRSSQDPYTITEKLKELVR